MASLTGWSFPVEIDKTTGKIKTVEDNENIKQGIKIILETQRGERKVRPSFGTDMNRFVFETIDGNFVSEISDEVGRSINTWEDNLAFLNVKAKSSPKNNSLVKVDIEYMTTISPELQGFSKIMDQNEDV
ncbi:MAG: GPW/gp25 family protein [Clostridia bacterium]|nr:GPW/gp25 family protein [Clostridia bacterium]